MFSKKEILAVVALIVFVGLFTVSHKKIKHNQYESILNAEPLHFSSKKISFDYPNNFRIRESKSPESLVELEKSDSNKIATDYFKSTDYVRITFHLVSKDEIHNFVFTESEYRQEDGIHDFKSGNVVIINRKIQFQSYDFGEGYGLKYFYLINETQYIVVSVIYGAWSPEKVVKEILNSMVTLN